MPTKSEAEILKKITSLELKIRDVNHGLSHAKEIQSGTLVSMNFLIWFSVRASQQSAESAKVAAMGAKKALTIAEIVSGFSFIQAEAEMAAEAALSAIEAAASAAASTSFAVNALAANYLNEDIAMKAIMESSEATKLAILFASNAIKFSNKAAKCMKVASIKI